MLQFANPWLLLLLLLLPLLAWSYYRRVRKGSGSLRLASTVSLEGVRSPWSVRARHVLFGLELAALALLLVAMARPQRGVEEEEVLSEGVDIILALDASGSMAAEDFAPRNRLTVAKMAAGKFIAGLKQDRAGLVTFAGKAVTSCPLTVDYSVLLTVLNAVDLDRIEDGTAIGSALATSLNRLRESKSKSKVIILLTDGVNNRGEIQPLDAARIAATLGVRIYTIGVGSHGTARFPVKDPNRGTVYMNLPVEIDEALLRQIAEMTEGIYYRATDKPSLEEIFESIGKLEKTEIEVRSYTRYSERFPALLLPALALVLATTLAGSTRFGKLP